MGTAKKSDRGWRFRTTVFLPFFWVACCFVISCYRTESEPDLNHSKNQNIRQILGQSKGTLQTALRRNTKSKNTPLVAYGINNMVDTIDYCQIAEDGQMQCYIYTGLDSPQRARVPREKWSLASYHIPPSDMDTLGQMLKSANLEKLAGAYHGKIADGIQQYLGVYTENGQKIVCFDNGYPPSCEGLIKYLDSLMKRAVSQGQISATTSSKAREQSPFQLFYRCSSARP